LHANKFTKGNIIGHIRKNCKEDATQAMNSLRKRLGKEVVEKENGRIVKRKKLFEDEDEIMMDKTIKFKFRCPITCKKIKIPVKGFYCEHIEWFDLESYISMNANFRSLKCPIWNKKAVSLQVDIINLKFNKILPLDTTEIKIKENMVAYWDSGVEVDLEKLEHWI